MIRRSGKVKGGGGSCGGGKWDLWVGEVGGRGLGGGSQGLGSWELKKGGRWELSESGR